MLLSYIISNILKIEKRKRFIDVQIPRNFMNCAITTDNFLIANTNDGSNWDTLKIPLPKPKNRWDIYNYKFDSINEYKIKYIKLVDYYWF